VLPQDGKLDQVLAGVKVLRAIGEDMKTEITMQGQILKDMDVQIDKTTGKFKVANRKMKELLEESGGASRWCPVLISIVIICALVGYCMTAAGK
jgi:hypothetical protein